MIKKKIINYYENVRTLYIITKTFLFRRTLLVYKTLCLKSLVVLSYKVVFKTVNLRYFNNKQNIYLAYH